MSPRALLLTFALSTALFARSEASAHAKLTASDPPAGAVVASPGTISLTFSEKLAPAFSTIEVVAADGRRVPVKTKVAADRRTISAAVQGRLAPGGYKVVWHAASTTDGHRMDGAVAFSVK